MSDLSAPDKVAMAFTLRNEASLLAINIDHLMTSRLQILKVADTLDPPSEMPQHSTASHMS